MENNNISIEIDTKGVDEAIEKVTQLKELLLEVAKLIESLTNNYSTDA